MSFKLVDVVFDIFMAGNAKIVLAVLCRHAHNDSTGSYPSVETIANESGLSKSTVMRALNYLESKQLIVAENERRQGGRQTVRWRIGFYLVDECQIDTRVPVSTVDGDGCQSDTPAVSHRHPSGVSLTDMGVSLTPESISKQSGEAVINPSIVAGVLDGLTDSFYKAAGKSLGLGAKQRDYLTTCLGILPAEVITRAFVKFANDGHDWSKVKSPAQLFCKRLNEYVRMVRHDESSKHVATQVSAEVIAEERARILADAGMTEEEYAREVEGTTCSTKE